eukprot:TRINITY_DN5306_c0_g1_i1.p1 TRINITY_DN5306_c0_g1~~TRINITY_DN5306_c0_g1_i1.p1  ORF type:complete len:751 (+),score=148.39 TRINITY_DN5306_c0_g1_i1:288-2255(+)
MADALAPVALQNQRLTLQVRHAGSDKLVQMHIHLVYHCCEVLVCDQPPLIALRTKPDEPTLIAPLQPFRGFYTPEDDKRGSTDAARSWIVITVSEDEPQSVTDFTKAFRVLRQIHGVQVLPPKCAQAWALYDRDGQRVLPGTVDANPDVLLDDARPVVHYPAVGVADAITLTRGDLHRLDSSVYLNDNLVNFYIKFMQREKMTPDMLSQCHFFNTFFFSSLQTRGYEAVKRWTKSVDIFTKKYIFIPINDAAHWTLIIVCNAGTILRPHQRASLPSATTTTTTTTTGSSFPSKDTSLASVMWFLDSMGGNGVSYASVVRSYLDAEARRLHAAGAQQQPMRAQQKQQKQQPQPVSRFAQLPVVAPRVMYQNNLHDCGMYLLQFLELFCCTRGASPPQRVKQFRTGEWKFSGEQVRQKRQALRVLIRGLQSDNGQSEMPATATATAAAVGGSEPALATVSPAAKGTGTTSTVSPAVSMRAFVARPATPVKLPFTPSPAQATAEGNPDTKDPDTDDTSDTDTSDTDTSDTESDSSASTASSSPITATSDTVAATRVAVKRLFEPVTTQPSMDALCELSRHCLSAAASVSANSAGGADSAGGDGGGSDLASVIRVAAGLTLCASTMIAFALLNCATTVFTEEKAQLEPKHAKRRRLDLE